MEKALSGALAAESCQITGLENAPSEDKQIELIVEYFDEVFNAVAQDEQIKAFYQAVTNSIANQPRPVLPIAGKAVIAFSLNDDGSISSIYVADSSGSPIIDDTALNTVLSTAPFPEPPTGARRTLSVTFVSKGHTSD